MIVPVDAVVCTVPQIYRSSENRQIIAMARVQTTEDHVIADVARLRKDAPGNIYSTPDPSLSAPTGTLTYLWVVWYALAWDRGCMSKLSLRIQATNILLELAMPAWHALPPPPNRSPDECCSMLPVASQDPGIEQAGDGLRRVDECCAWVDVWVCHWCMGGSYFC
jgi:hypothetical protein